MPLFSNVNLGVPKPLDLADYQPTFGEQVSAGFEAAFQSNPMQILERRKKMAGLDDIAWEDSQLPLDAREIIDAEEYADEHARKVLPLEDQERQIKEAGLEGQLKPVEGYRQEALDIVIDHERMENALAAMNPGLGASLLGGLAAGVLDPINLASSIVPVIGQQRVMSMMAAAYGIGQRGMIRAGIGAASGAAGAAMLEPMIYLGQQEVQADYTLANSLQNLFIGSLMGGFLHSTFGTFGEWRRARSGKPQPWEYVPPNFQTEEWKKAHAEDLFRKQMEATPEADPEIVRQWAEGEAVKFDAHARSWAYHEKKTVKEYYDKWGPEYRTGFDDSVWREAMPDELLGNTFDDGDLGWIGRQYEGLRTLNADAMALPEFLDNLALWEERFPDLHDYAGIRQRIEDARAGRIFDPEILDQLAYHGTPHRFKKFSLRRIGSGEGAQVHGWGLYFAQDRKVATGYRVRLGGSGYTYKGQPLIDLYTALEDRGEYAKVGILDEFMTAHDLADMDLSAYDPKVVEWFKKEIHPKLKGDGRLYVVDIPENSVLLDEQKPISQQDPEVRAALERAADSMPDDEQWANMAEYIYGVLENDKILGRDFYNALATLGTKNFEDTLTISSKGAKKASEFLNHFGIKGITYVGNDDGRCFVIFDDKAINITDTLYQLEDAPDIPYSERKLAEEIARWETAVDKVVSELARTGKPPSSAIKMLDQTPLIMRLIGTDTVTGKAASTGGIYVSPHVFDGKHPNMTPEMWKQFPKAMADPIAIFDSDSPGGRANGDIVFMVEIKDENGATVVVPVALNASGKLYSVINIVKSAYTKERDGVPSNKWFAAQLKKNARYVNGQKLENWGIGSGADSPLVASNISGNKIYTEKDFVKLKNSNPLLYQTAPSNIGNKTEILGANSKEIARYELRELEDVIPSHHPENNFKRRSDYPEIAQERPYHSDDGEQQKVMGNALGYEPGFVISTDASATNGPPIITSKGIVLGGNSRAMTLQLVYGKFPEKAAAYRKALMDNAAQFGLDPNAVASMKKPMLVRAVSGDLTPEQMAKRSREYNQTTTQQLQGEAEGISRARFVDRPTLNALVAGLKDGRTISEFLASPESADFAIHLQDAGVLQQSEIASLIYPGSGKLNDAGKARVMQIMRGLVLPDYDIMTSLPKGVLNNLDASIPVLALSRMRGEGWDLTGAFYEAMRMTAEAKNKGVPIEQQFFQHTLAGSADPMRDNPAVQALALLFSKSDPKEMRMRMEHYLSLADSEGAGQNALIPGMGITPDAAFKKAFLEPLVFIGNERVPNFNPSNNPRHAALQWAIEHGGKTPTIEKTLAKLEKEIAKKNVAPEEKTRLAEYKKELAALSGVVGMRKPKLGEFWKEPDRIEIPAGKKPGEKGALPEAAHIEEPVSLNDPDALLPPELQENPRPVVRGSVTFRAEDRPLVTFFQSADFSTAPHELFHIFRREMEQTALSPDGSLHAREQWKRICEFVGARPDEKWSVEMEEKFANAGLRYLAEGQAPSPSLQGVFERIKAWFMELFQRAEDIGAEISPEMRKAFDGMFEVPFETADRNFRRAMGELHSREVEQEFADPDTIGKPLSPDDQRLAETGGNLHDLEELTREAQIRADEAAARLDQNNPELRDVIEETNAELAEIDAEIARVGERDEMRRQAVECLVNGG